MWLIGDLKKKKKIYVRQQVKFFLAPIFKVEAQVLLISGLFECMLALGLGLVLGTFLPRTKRFLWPMAVCFFLPWPESRVDFANQTDKCLSATPR